MINISGFPGGSGVKNPPANTGDPRDAGSVPGLGRSPWRRKWQPTPIFLPGKSQGQRSLAGYSPRGRKQLDTSECTHTHTHTRTHTEDKFFNTTSIQILPKKILFTCQKTMVSCF